MHRYSQQQQQQGGGSSQKPTSLARALLCHGTRRQRRHTQPSVQSVELFGSWDNFSKPHRMERDARRDRGQWRGCHSFQDIVCDGLQSSPEQKRSGGLRMGQTYYYYYEVDGGTETFDPAMPSTTACPYLPGQAVNTLEVPIEQPSRSRTASMSLMCPADYRTMNPMDKYSTPRPTATASDLALPTRVGSSPSPELLLRPSPELRPSPDLRQKRSTRSLSPSPRWVSARRFFGLRPSSRGRGAMVLHDAEDACSVASCPQERTRSTTPSEGSRSRDLSPESLRRFLSDDGPKSPPAVEATPRLSIPEQIVEENEDDDNFATSANSDSQPYTLLSPPPVKRSRSSPSLTSCDNESSTTIVPDGVVEEGPCSPMAIRNSLVGFALDIPGGHFSDSATSSAVSSPIDSEASLDAGHYSSLDESNDEDDDDYSPPPPPSRRFPVLTRPRADELPLRQAPTPFVNYSLPHLGADAKRPTTAKGSRTAGLPAFVARGDHNLPLLARPETSHGLGDLAHEIGWLADIV